MKLSVVVKSKSGWHLDRLREAAERRGVEFELVQISPKKDLEHQAQALGDVVLWRSAYLDHLVSRPTFGQYLRGEIIVNDTIFRYPNTPQKYYQQTKLRTYPTTKKYAIPTALVAVGCTPDELAQQNKLEYPLIMKPNLGAMGKGVMLLKSANDPLATQPVDKDMVLQQFIPNDGDWRVIVLGGVPLGAMKRIAKEGGYLNNISQGATATRETDPEQLAQLYSIAVKAASVMGLRFAGVDIIRDRETGKFHILETNSAPQWDGEYGFQSMTGVDVAEAFVDYASSLYRRSKVASPLRLIEENYKRYINRSPSDAFHFASRMWLWTGDEWARQYLDSDRARYIGSDEASIRRTVSQLFENPSPLDVENPKSPHRLPYYDKYPMLRIYLPVLFKVIFCDSVYGIDIRPCVTEHVSDQELLQLFHKLLADKDAIRVLSTHAINYFYLLRNYFKGTLSKSSATLLDPTELRALANSYDHLIEKGTIDKTTAVKLRIYLLTHAIIGESRFYQQRVNRSSYRKLCKDIEAIIAEHYADVTLDNKVEFLVCCRLTEYDSCLRPIILSEAKRSLSWAGNFLVDTLNSHADTQKAHALNNAEHRNVLYLMARKKMRQLELNSAERVLLGEQKRIGRLARVVLEDFNIRLIARVDSGATNCSLAVSNIHEATGRLSFSIGRPNDPFYTGETITVDQYRKLNVKTSTAVDERYVVTLKVKINAAVYNIDCTLSSRSHMLYPMLIGRSLLTGNFIVDTSKQFI